MDVRSSRNCDGGAPATTPTILSEGAYVGEISLLTGDVATASVVACGPVELAALPAGVFYRVVSEYPELWVAMRDEADARRLHTARVLAGRTAVV